MANLGSCVDFLQRLLQTPSRSGQEGEIANLIVSEMKKLGYDVAYTDEAGNVIGCIEGTGEAPPMMFNTHLDHVDVGDQSAWPHPPFGGVIHDDAIWGRGAVDIKGPLATQVYGVAPLVERGHPPPGDVFVTSVVQEEIGGVGTRHLLTHLAPDFVVVGEPSQNNLRRGHRGRLELVVHIEGRSVHASAPSRGVNPLEVAAHFIGGIGALDMSEDPDLGKSTVVPTLIKTNQESSNVIPSEIWLTCDWRNVPGESENDAQKVLQSLADESLVHGATVDVSIPTFPRRTYTGLEMEIPASNYPFITRSDDPVLRAAQSVLQKTLNLFPDVGFWDFATDGGHFARADLAVIGLGPGDEALAHTVNEHVPLTQLENALTSYEALASQGASTLQRVQ